MLPHLRAGLPVPAAAQPQAAQQAPRQLVPGAGGTAATAAVAAAELAGLTAEELAGWDDWGDEEEQGDGSAWHHDPQQQQQQQQQQQRQQQRRSRWQADGEQEAAVEVQWDAPEDAAPPAEHSARSQQHWQAFGSSAAWQPGAAQLSAALPGARPAASAGGAGGMQLEVSFDYDCGDECNAGAEAAVDDSEQQTHGGWGGGGAPSCSQHAAEQQRQQQQQQCGGAFAWEAAEQAHPSPAAAGYLAGSWGQPSAAAGEAGTEAACVWAALGDGGEQEEESMQEGEQQPMAVVWEADEEAACDGPAAASGAAGAGPEHDPWAAFEPETAARPGTGWAAPWASPTSHAASPPAAPACSAAAGVAALGWGCDLQWEEEEQEAAAADGGSASLMQLGSPGGVGTQAAAPQQPVVAFEWEFDDGVAEPAPAAGGGAAGAAQRLAQGLGLAGSRAAAPVPAHKRRHAEIGAQIIRSLLEERRRGRVDLQPLLLQLSRQLAAALAGGGTVALSALRQRCMSGGEPGTQASLQVGWHAWWQLTVLLFTLQLCCTLPPSSRSHPLPLPSSPLHCSATCWPCSLRPTSTTLAPPAAHSRQIRAARQARAALLQWLPLSPRWHRRWVRSSCTSLRRLVAAGTC